MHISNISTHALLAEGDGQLHGLYYRGWISTHALLAEGDQKQEGLFS